MKDCEIHIWGDSIARGVVYDDVKKRYALSPERLSARLKACGARLVDRSAMGATSEDGLTRFGEAPTADGALCLIEYGGNDCDLDWAAVADSPGHGWDGKVPLARYAEVLARFIAEARARGMEPMLLTPPPLSAPRYFAWVTRGLDAERVRQALGDVEHIYRWQERYTIAMRRVAGEAGCRLIDLRDAFLARMRDDGLLCADGIHPSDEGHRLLSDTVIAALD